MSVKHLIAPSVMTLALAGLVACGTKKKDDAPQPPAAKPEIQLVCEAEVKAKADKGDKYEFKNTDLATLAEIVGIKDFGKELSNDKCAELAGKAAAAKTLTLGDKVADFESFKLISSFSSAEKIDLAGAVKLKDVTHQENTAKVTADNTTLTDGDTDEAEPGAIYVAKVETIAKKEAKGEAVADADKTELDTLAKAIETRFTADVTRDAYEALVKLVEKTKHDNSTLGADALNALVVTNALEFLAKITTLTDLDLDKTNVKTLVALKDLKALVNLGLHSAAIEKADLDKYAKAKDEEKDGKLKVIYTAKAKPAELKKVEYKDSNFDLKSKITKKEETEETGE